MSTQPATEGIGTLCKLANALLKVKNGIADAYIADIGDDLKVGFNASPEGLYENARHSSYPKILSDMLSAKGFVVNNDALIGDRNLGTAFNNYGTYDPRIIAPFWGLSTSGAETGGGLIGNSFQSETQNIFSYTPSKAFNRVDIVFVGGVGGAAMEVLINGVIIQTNIHDENVGYFVRTYSTTSPGVHTIGIRRSDPQGRAQFLAIFPCNTTIKQVYLHTYASVNATASSWSQGNGLGLDVFLNTINVAYCSLLIGFGINEIANHVSPTQFKTNFQNKINLFKTHGNGDVILQNPPWTNVTNVPQIDYLSQTYTIARTERYPFDEYPIVEANLISGSNFSEANTDNYMSDNTHWTAKGYSMLARATLATIMSGVKHIFY